MLTKTERKHIRSLKIKKFRDQEKLFVVEGVKMVQEALDSEYRVRSVYVQEDELVSWGDAPTRLVTEQEMSEITHFLTPSPALAVVEIPVTNLFQIDAPTSQSNLYLALDSIRDPGNFGTILRIADWFGIHTVFASPDSVDLYNPKVIQSSMGAIFRVPVYYVDLVELIDRLNIPVFGAFLEGESLYEAKLSNNGVIIVGNESNGISDALKSIVNHKIMIPPCKPEPYRSESLNAAMATAVICAEFRRQYPFVG